MFGHCRHTGGVIPVPPTPRKWIDFFSVTAAASSDHRSPCERHELDVLLILGHLAKSSSITQKRGDYSSLPKHAFMYKWVKLILVCKHHIFQFSSVQSLSRVWLFATLWTTARQASLSITNFQSSLRLTSIESVMPSNHLILCRPLLLLPPIPHSIRVFSNESVFHIKWPKY